MSFFHNWKHLLKEILEDKYISPDISNKILMEKFIKEQSRHSVPEGIPLLKL